MKKLLVFFGLIASGKSTLAREYAREQGLSYFNTDVVRKEMLGIDPSEKKPAPMGEGIYSAENSRKTYDLMLEKASSSLAEGCGVVLDGSYSSEAERRKVVELAKKNSCPLLFVLCQCSEEETRKRLEHREKDSSAVSDGRWEIYQQQKELFAFPDELAQEMLLVLVTEAPVEELVSLVMKRI